MKPTQVAIAVVEHEGRFLIGQRADHLALGGKWEFPGGKVEPWEMPDEAAVRECLEETGLEVEIVGEHSGRVEAYEHATVQLRFFACRPRDPSQSPREPFRWVPRRALGEYEFPAGNRELLTILLASD